MKSPNNRIILKDNVSQPNNRGDLEAEDEEVGFVNVCLESEVHICLLEDLNGNNLCSTAAAPKYAPFNSNLLLHVSCLECCF